MGDLYPGMDLNEYYKLAEKRKQSRTQINQEHEDLKKLKNMCDVIKQAKVEPKVTNSPFDIRQIIKQYEPKLIDSDGGFEIYEINFPKTAKLIEASLIKTETSDRIVFSMIYHPDAELPTSDFKLIFIPNEVEFHNGLLEKYKIYGFITTLKFSNGMIRHLFEVQEK